MAAIAIADASVAEASTSTASDFQPGQDVKLVGLKGDASLNGQRGIVKPKSEWPTEPSRIGRIAIFLPDKKKTIAVKPENLSPWVAAPTCLVCLEEGNLLALGCGCRGSVGMVHEACAIKAAAAQQERQGTWAGKHPWQLCSTCRLPYTGALKLALAQEWCRRCEQLDRKDMQRFAARTMLGNALSAAGRLAEAEVVVRDNLHVCNELHGTEHRHTLGTNLNLGLLLDGQGKHDEAASEYTRIIEIQTRVLGAEHRDTLNTAMQLAGSDLSRGRNAEAEQKYRDILKLQESCLGADDQMTLTCGMNLASSLLNQARYDEAEAAYSDNLQRKSRKLGPDHVDTLMVAMNLGSVYKERGDYKRAEESFQSNWESKKRVLGVTHADTCFAALNLVSVWVEGGRIEAYSHRCDEAVALAEATHDALVKQFGENHPMALCALMHVGASLYNRATQQRVQMPNGSSNNGDDVVKAAELLKKAYKAQIAAHNGNDSHPDVLETAWRLGTLLADEGNLAHFSFFTIDVATLEPSAALASLQGGDTNAYAAIKLLRLTSAKYEEQLGETHPRTLRTLASLSEAMMLDGYPPFLQEAKGLLLKAEAGQKALLDEGHPELARTVELLARCEERIRLRKLAGCSTVLAAEDAADVAVD